MSTAERTRIEHWWPSRYGQDDEIGSLSEITPAATLRGVSVVRQGTVFDLSHSQSH